MALICDSMNLVLKQSATKLYYLQIRQSQWSPAYKTPILDKNQFEELEKIYKQLLIEKEDLNNQLNDRSIVVGHHSASDSNIVEEEVCMVYFL